MNVSCWIYPAVACISPPIGSSQADPNRTLEPGVAKPSADAIAIGGFFAQWRDEGVGIGNSMAASNSERIGQC
jgi:hypothetical protein